MCPSGWIRVWCFSCVMVCLYLDMGGEGGRAEGRGERGMACCVSVRLKYKGKGAE